jgi:hypothetical protein
VLDITVASVSRQVINFGLSPLEDSNDLKGVSRLAFDFLDYRDGAVLRILMDKPTAQLDVRGTVIGIPTGIYQVDELRNSGSKRLLRLLAVFLVSMLIWIIPLLSLFHISGQLSPSPKVSPWMGPIFVVCFIVMMIFMYFTVPWISSPDRRWPKSLGLPDWFVSDYDRHRLGLK